MCDDECRLRWDEYADASADPHTTTRVTCITHGVIGSSDTRQASTTQRIWQREEALGRLVVAHQQLDETS